MEVAAVFLDNSKSFDKVEHKGIFKMRQNGSFGGY